MLDSRFEKRPLSCLTAGRAFQLELTVFDAGTELLRELARASSAVESGNDRSVDRFERQRRMQWRREDRAVRCLVPRQRTRDGLLARCGP